MKRILFSVICMTLSLTTWAQSDVFGNPVPGSAVRKNLPDSPNITDARGWKQGEWSKKYDNGNYRYKAVFKDDVLVGEMIRYFENGKKSAVITVLGSGKSSAKLFDEAEKLMGEGLYVDNKRDSIWRFYNEQGELSSTEPYSAGVLDGVMTIYYPNGDVAEEMVFVKGVKHGPWKQYYRKSGKRLEGTYENGLLQGKYKTYDLRGVCDVDGQYDKGLEQGNWTVWDADENKSYIVKYKNSVIQNSKELDERQSKKMADFERVRRTLKDPDQYRNDPDGYIR